MLLCRNRLEDIPQRDYCRARTFFSRLFSDLLFLTLLVCLRNSQAVPSRTPTRQSKKRRRCIRTSYEMASSISGLGLGCPVFILWDPWLECC